MTSFPARRLLEGSENVFLRAERKRPVEAAQGRCPRGVKSIVYGTPGMIRTCDPLIRSQVLYPAELRVRLQINRLQITAFDVKTINPWRSSLGATVR